MKDSTIATAAGVVIAQQRHIDLDPRAIPRPTVNVQVGVRLADRYRKGALIGQLTTLSDVLLTPSHPRHEELLELIRQIEMSE